MKEKYKLILAAVVIPIMLTVSAIPAQAEEVEYDDLNRVTKVTYDDGSYVEYEYDRNGNIVSINVYDANEEQRNETENGSGQAGQQEADSGTLLPDESEQAQENADDTKDEETLKSEEPDKEAEKEDTQKEEADKEGTLGEKEAEESEISQESGDDIDPAEQPEKLNFFEKIMAAVKEIFLKIIQWIQSLFQ